MATKKKVTKKKAKKKKVNKVPDKRNRVTKIKDAQRDELRNKFKGIEYIRQLEQSAKDYDALHKKAKGKRVGLIDRDILKLQIDIIKAKVDLNLRRLKFVLPELKAISFEDGDGKSLTEQFFEAMSSAAKNNNI